MENLDCMRRLRQLNLSYNRIIIVEGIFLLRKLEELNLSHNYIEELPKDFRDHDWTEVTAAAQQQTHPTGNLG
jgi:Leucine-rich repeat (LRR) protein